MTTEPVTIDLDPTDDLAVPHSRDVEHFHQTVAEAIAKSRYTAWNDRAGALSWDDFTADSAHEAEVTVYREDGARDADQVMADLIASDVIAVLVLPAGFAG